MSSVNKVILVGNLGRDPESKSFQNGGGLVTFAIATSESWKDRAAGERKERTEWHNIVITAEGLCKVATSYLRKGSKVYVEGQLRTRKWQANDGSDRYSTEIVIGPMKGVLTLLDKAQREPGRDDYSQHQDEGRFGGSELDDEVPF